MTEVLPLDTSPLPVRLTVDDYLLLEDAGAFADYAKTELIDGEIVYVHPRHREHGRIASRLFLALGRALKAVGGMEAIVDGAIGIPPNNSPGPDIVVTNEPEGMGLIPLASVRLVIEVSDTTITFDTVRKLELYARFGIAEYWVVDVNARLVLQHLAPDDRSYAGRVLVPFGEPVVAATIPGLTVPTDTL